MAARDAGRRVTAPSQDHPSPPSARGHPPHATRRRPHDRPARAPAERGGPLSGPARKRAPAESDPGGMDPGRRGMREASEGTRSRRTIRGFPPGRGSEAPASGPHPGGGAGRSHAGTTHPRTTYPGTRCQGTGRQGRRTAEKSPRLPGVWLREERQAEQVGEGSRVTVSRPAEPPGGTHVEPDPSPRPRGAVRRAGGSADGARDPRAAARVAAPGDPDARPSDAGSPPARRPRPGAARRDGSQARARGPDRRGGVLRTGTPALPPDPPSGDAAAAAAGGRSPVRGPQCLGPERGEPHARSRRDPRRTARTGRAGGAARAGRR